MSGLGLPSPLSCLYFLLSPCNQCTLKITTAPSSSPASPLLRLPHRPHSSQNLPGMILPLPTTFPFFKFSLSLARTRTWSLQQRRRWQGAFLLYLWPWFCHINPGESWDPHFGRLPLLWVMVAFQKHLPPPAAAQLLRALPKRTTYLGFDQLGRRWNFALVANRIGAVIPCGLTGHGKVNVGSLGQNKRGHYLELDLSNKCGAGTRELKPAVGNEGDV